MEVKEISFYVTGVFLLVMCGCEKPLFKQAELQVKVVNGCLDKPMKGATVALFNQTPTNGQFTLDIEKKRTNENGVVNYQNVNTRKGKYSVWNVNSEGRDRYLSEYYHFERTNGVYYDEIHIFPRASLRVELSDAIKLNSDLDSVIWECKHLQDGNLLKHTYTGTGRGIASSWMGSHKLKYTIYSNGQVYSTIDTIQVGWGENVIYTIDR